MIGRETLIFVACLVIKTALSILLKWLAATMYISSIHADDPLLKGGALTPRDRGHRIACLERQTEF